MSRHNVILLAAGGTAGHMFPASALARELKADGYEVHLATDRRGLRFVEQMEKMTIHKIPAATVFGGGVLALPVRALTLIYAFLFALITLLRIKPDVIVGFGGYPSFPPVFAAMILRKPVLIHEQNAVLGRANRLAALLGASLATSFNTTAKVPWGAGMRLRKTGNPLRREVIDAARGGYRYLAKSRPFDLLIFGGSQGAKVFSNVVPAAIGRLSAENRKRLRVVHQVQKGDMADVLKQYGEIGVYAEIRDYFDDLPSRMRRAHLVICRGGAATVGELTLLGAPAIIVPLPGSLDQDQAHNILELSEAGGAYHMPQTAFSPEGLGELLDRMMQDDERLRRMSAIALQFAEPDAAMRLANYTICLAERRPVQIEGNRKRSGVANG